MDTVDPITAILREVRRHEVSTRSMLADGTGLGRNLVAQSVNTLVSLGLVKDGLPTQSTGGRTPKGLTLNPDAGCILVAELGATSTSVAVSDLSGLLLARVTEDSDVRHGPERVLRRVAKLMRQLLSDHHGPVWGVGIGVPGPVEFQLGRPVAPPIMPGWDGFDIRGFFSEAFGAPTWVDNEVNLMALGELRDGAARRYEDLIYVKIGTGIGAGIISQKKLHRGAQGCAGDIGHMPSDPQSAIACRCGQIGCLEALAGGAALARLGRAAASSGVSPYLATMAMNDTELEAIDVGEGALQGDATCVHLIQESARILGEALAGIVNFFNPSLLLLGGGVAQVGDLYLARVRQAVLQRSLPLATRNLRIEVSPLGGIAGLKGAAFMVADELFSPERASRWIESGTPAGFPGLAA